MLWGTLLTRIVYKRCEFTFIYIIISESIQSWSKLNRDLLLS